MENAFLIFWTVMIFASIAWYAYLLFYVGAKGGREILQMTDDLARRKPPDEDRFRSPAQKESPRDDRT